MTYEEAYKILTEHTRHYVPTYDIEALEVAIKVLGDTLQGEEKRIESYGEVHT